MQTGSMNNSIDISLIDLIKILYRKKWWIIIVTALSLSVGLWYLFQVQPLYQAEVTLAPARNVDTAAFNSGRSWYHSVIKPIYPNDIYAVFAEEINSKNIKQEFLNQVYQPYLKQHESDQLLVNYELSNFNSNLTVIENVRTAGQTLPKFTLSLRGYDANQSAILLSQFVHFAQKYISTTVINTLKKQDEVQIYNFQHQIDVARANAFLKRKDKIIQLEEQIKLTQVGPSKGAENINGEKQRIAAQIQILKTRQSDDAFIPNLRALEDQIDYFKSLKIDLNNVSVFRQESPIVTPTKPIFPNFKKIIVLSLLLGILSSIFLVLVYILWNQRLRAFFINNKS